MKRFLYITLVIIGLLFFSCKQGEANTETTDNEIMEIVLPEPEPASDYDSGNVSYVKQEAADDKSDFSPTIQEEISYAKKIIKTATIRYEVTNLENEKNRLKQNIDQLKGVVVTETSKASENTPQIEFQLNIPSENFDSFISNLEKNVSYFELKEITRQDITRDYVDVQSRLKNQRALELRYLELLKQAKNVSEILEIEQNLNNVRTEIEIAENRLKLYDRQVQYSNVNLTIFKNNPYAKTPDQTFGSKTNKAIVGGFDNFVNSFIDILYLWPFFLIILIISIWLFLKYRKYKKKHP